MSTAAVLCHSANDNGENVLRVGRAHAAVPNNKGCFFGGQKYVERILRHFLAETVAHVD